MLVVGVLGVAVFYVAVMAVGIWAGNKQLGNSEESVMLAGRQLGLVVGVFTLVATWVGAGFISGIPEMVYNRGVIWCLVPVGYSLSFLVGGMLFAAPMRRAGYVTMMDPFQEAYGERVGALLFLPALLGDIFWSAAILATLGSALSVVLHLSPLVSVVGSAVFVAAYTMLGGLYSVAYTDVIQLLCIVLGLVLSAPYAWHHPAAWHGEGGNGVVTGDWVGTVESWERAEWLDMLLLLVFGGIPWQSYFQRILSMKNVATAQILSFAAFFSCLLMAIPAVTIGVIAKETDWSNVTGFERNITNAEAAYVLPIVLRYLTPEWVSFIGLGAVSAAVMSSADSSLLAASSVFARNIYRVLLRPKASQSEVIWVLRISVVVMAIVSSFVALTIPSIYYLSTICSDLIYVLLFPQLLLTVYWRSGVNSAGCIASFVVGLMLRLSCGEPGLGLPSLLSVDEGLNKLPCCTISMLAALLTHVLVSRAASAIQASRLNRGRRDETLAREEG